MTISPSKYIFITVFLLAFEGARKISIQKPEEPLEPEEKKPRIRRGLYNMNIHQVKIIFITILLFAANQFLKNQTWIFCITYLQTVYTSRKYRM